MVKHRPNYGATAHTVPGAHPAPAAGTGRRPVPVPCVRTGGLYLRAPSTRGAGVCLYLYLRFVYRVPVPSSSEHLPYAIFDFDDKCLEITVFTSYMSFGLFGEHEAYLKFHVSPVVTENPAFSSTVWSYRIDGLSTFQHPAPRVFQASCTCTLGAHRASVPSSTQHLGYSRQPVPAPMVTRGAGALGAKVSTVCGVGRRRSRLSMNWS